MTKLISGKSCSILFMVLFFLTINAHSSIASINTFLVVPPCTTLSSPLSGDTGVPINSNLSWNSVSTATGYKLTVGTSSGGTDILNAFDVGDVLIYDLPTDLPETTTIYVSITPYNLDGDALACGEEFFNTFAPNVLRPICTVLTNPLNRAIRVPLETDFSWDSISNAAGYRLSIGSTSGGTDILNMFDVGNVLSYDLPMDLPEFTTIYVTVTPYNIAGDAFACEEVSFTTKSLIPVPACTGLLLPLANATNVPVDTDLEWNPVSGATGYILTLETFTTGTDVLNIIDLGNVTSYSVPADLPENTTIYVIIEPYNDGGEAIACIEEIFNTGDFRAADIPPKFFTPNGDTINDYWIVPNPLNEVSKVFIYDRYGKLIKQLNDLSVGWDGTFNGNPMPANGYWYQIVFLDGKVSKGYFSLVR